MNDRVIYTCVTNGYDKLHQPKIIYKGYDYICFTDEVRQKNVGIWQIRPIPNVVQDKIRLSRYLKINPHIALSEYSYSVYVDSNILILDEYLLDRVENEIKKGTLIALSKHPEGRLDIYEEAAYVMKYRRAKFKEVRKQIKYLLKMGYPHGTGMFENNIIFRQHNHNEIIKLDENWWDIFIEFTSRDQLSFAYLLWKFNITPSDIMSEGERLNIKSMKKDQSGIHLQRINHSVREAKEYSMFKKCWNYFRYLIYEIPRFRLMKFYFQHCIQIIG